VVQQIVPIRWKIKPMSGFQQDAQPLPHNLMVVRQYDPDSSINFIE